tara:strand:+ start:15488 stop:16858 length:1371 start_codon:yes stop_codon:yes gene_type:complete
MFSKDLKLNNRNLILTNIFNFVFVSFIFLSGIKYDYFQIRILIFALLFPCVVNIIYEKNFSNIKIFLFFFLILVIHSVLNIYFENSELTLHSFYGIISLTAIFIISFYYFDKFNDNIKNIINVFLIIFFISICISFFNYQESGDNLFCGGIKVFEILTFIDRYLPLDVDLKAERIEEVRFAFNEIIFNENSHLGMVAPSIIIYLIYFNSQKKTSLLSKMITFIFICVCLIKSSTTLLLGTSISLFLISFFNYKIISANTLKLFALIFILFIGIFTFDNECRSRLVPTYGLDVPDNTNISNVEVVGDINKNLALMIKKFMKTGGSLSSGVHFHAISIAKKSIIEKPFGWGINRYDAAFKYFNGKNPSKIERLNRYNNKDGTNNFVKIVVEFGIFSILFYFFILLFLINKKIPIDLKFFYLPFIITQSLRGAGYFNGGFSLIIFLMLFTYINVYKKAE